MQDPSGLDRFVVAQDTVLDQVRRELDEGRKRTHWMWFVFPQLAGLGQSPTARRYAIASIGEARAYLAHPVLGPRLIECTDAVNRLEDRSAHEIFGRPDDLKFHSSMTLFAHATGEPSSFQAALGKYFGGQDDEATLRLLEGRRDRTQSTAGS